MRASISASTRLFVRPRVAASQSALVRGHATSAVNAFASVSELGVGETRLEPPSPIARFTKEEISEIYHSPLLPLVFRAAGVHAANHDPTKIQLCTLLNIKSA